MHSYLLKQRKQLFQEEGFSLMEVMVAILIVGILAAIAVPVYINAQNESAAQITRSYLQEAGMIFEQEQIDNNGLFPTYLPNEFKDNKNMKDFVYSYSDTRTSFCVQAPSRVGKLFVSSESKQISGEICTQSNIPTGGNTPWQAPAVSTPLITSANNSWGSTVSASTSTIALASGSCTLAAEDQGEWAGSTTTQFRVKITNTTQNNATITTTWNATRNVSQVLNGWLPTDVLKYESQVRCIVSNGIDFPYASSLSAPVAGTVATYTVNPVSFITTNARWVNTTTFNVNSSWTAGFCPSGTKQRQFNTLSGATAMPGFDGIAFPGWTGNINADRTTWGTSQETTLKIRISCLNTNGVRVTSPETSRTIATAIRPPSAPSGLATETILTESVRSIPTGLRWTGTTCTVGTPQYKVVGTGIGTGTWQTGLTYSLGEQTIGNQYSYAIHARCVEGAATSIDSAASNTVTYTAMPAMPEPPGRVTGITTNINTNITINTGRTISWSAQTCSVVGSTVEYQVQRTRTGTAADPIMSTAWISGGATTYAIPTEWMNRYGSIYGFTVQARCVNQSGVANGIVSAEVTNILGVPAPTGNFTASFYSGDQGAQYTAATCPAGTVAEYTLRQTLRGSDNLNTILQGWSPGVKQSSLGAGFRYGHPLRVEAKARCAGTNAFGTEIGNLANTTSPQNLPWNSGGQMHYNTSPSWCVGCGSQNARLVASCTVGSNPTNLRIEIGKNGSQHMRWWMDYNGEVLGPGYIGNGGWGSNWFVRAAAKCTSPWVVSGDAYFWEGSSQNWGNHGGW